MDLYSHLGLWNEDSYVNFVCFVNNNKSDLSKVIKPQFSHKLCIIICDLGVWDMFMQLWLLLQLLNENSVIVLYGCSKLWAR